MRVVSRDRRAADFDVNILAHIGLLGHSRTGGSHRLIGIDCHDNLNVPPPSDVSFLTGNGLLRGRNRRHVATDPRTMVAHHPYIKKVDDRLAERDRD